MKAFRVVLVICCFGVVTALASAQASGPPKKGEQKTPPKVKAPKGKLPGADGLATKLPDLIVSDLDLTGPLKYVDNAWRIPAKARLTNQGAGDAKFCGLGASYIDGFFPEPPPPAKFVRQATFWNANGVHAHCPDLQAGKSVTIIGYFTISDPMKKLEGSKVFFRLFVDAQTDDAVKSPGGKIKESNEDNNWSKAVSVTIGKGDLAAEVFDLAVELDEEHLGAGKYRLTAKVKNVGNGNYKGGGQLIIRREGVGKELPEPKLPLKADSVPDKELLKKTIPALGDGKSVTFTVDTLGRGIFTAITAGVQESNFVNNAKQINLLKKQNVTLDGKVFDALIGSTLAKTDIHLHHTGAYVDLPGFLPKKTFNLPSYHKHFDILDQSVDIYYKVNDINSDKTTVSFKDKGLSVVIDFETKGSEISGTGTGPDKWYPDINTPVLQVSAAMPLTFDKNLEYFQFTKPAVKVKADWQFNIENKLIREWLSQMLLGDVNPKIETAVGDLLGSQANLLKINDATNKAFRLLYLTDAFGNTGRIVSASIGGGLVKVEIETPK